MTTKAVNLQWQLRSYNETAVQVWRGTDSTGGSYQLIATLPPGTSTYKDSTITGNANYYYEVNVTTASAQSNYSNYVYANPYAYVIYLSYSAGFTAPAPWNNIGVLPTLGYVANNFLDANGNVTATGQIQTGTWGGLYAGGMQTGNNSGIVPDAVMIASYGLFPGTTGTVQLTGMDLNMSYDLTFFGSANNTGDNNGLYTANGKSALLNATENETGEVTIFGVQADAYGNINVSCTPGTPTSQFGLMNAVIIQGHSLSPSGSLPGAPGGGTQGTVTGTTAISAQAMTLTNPDSAQDLKQLSAYPNPFTQQFTLLVPANSMNESVQVTIFDISGRPMYVKEFDNLTQGNNYLMINPGAAISQHGVYIVRVMYSDKTTIKFIKMLRM
jgi:large repetitive protein